jgi:hypothetical protein
MYNAHRRFFPFTENFCIFKARVIDGQKRSFSCNYLFLEIMIEGAADPLNGRHLKAAGHLNSRQ